MRRWLLAPIVLTLFGLAFAESWAALVRVARAAEIPFPKPWPWMVDGFIIAMALLIVEALRLGHVRGAWWPRIGLFAATGLSTTIQAFYAPQDQWYWALHAWSPLAVLASFECLVWLVFSSKDQVAVSQPKAPAPARLRAWIASGMSQPTAQDAGTSGPSDVPAPVPARSQSTALSAAQRRKVGTWVDQGRSKLWITQELGLSDRARKEIVGPLVDELVAAKVSMNGDRSHG